MKNGTLLSVFTCLLVTSVCYGYIPNTQFIIESVTKNHGKGHYVIEQEVTFPVGNDHKVVYETWHVEGGNQLYLNAHSAGLKIERYYSNGTTYFKDKDGTLKKRAWSEDFLEPWFVTRSAGYFKKLILNHRVAPRNVFKYAPGKREEGKDENSFVRLSRTGGVITYALGTPTPPDQAQPLPGLWVEQDKFVIRKLRLPSAAEVSADEYGDYSKNMKFPKSRVISWDQFSIPVRVLSVNWYNSNRKKIKEKMSLNGFRKKEDNNTVFDSENEARSLLEFYTRFR